MIKIFPFSAPPLKSISYVFQEMTHIQEVCDFMQDLDLQSIHWISLPPSQLISTHEHNHKTVMIITSGQGKLESSEATKKIRAPSLLLIPEKNLHGFYALSLLEGLAFHFAPTDRIKTPENRLSVSK